MSALAEVLLSRGCRVTGSDLHDQSRITHLSQRGARIHLGHRAAALGCPDLVVISSAIPPTNPELRAAHQRGIPVRKRGEFLAELTRDRRCVVVAGTHGKTTTGALVAHILRRQGWDPTVLLGGELQELGAGGYAGNGEWAVTEGDESDGSFLLLRPDLAVVTSLEDDHLIHYGTPDHLDQAFRRFGERVKPGGALVFNADDPRVRACCGTEPAATHRLSYGVRRSGPGLCIGEITHRSGFSTFSFRCSPGTMTGRVRCPLPGRHTAISLPSWRPLSGTWGFRST
jgi:UDP-N-acetylmuramate--alanine ligase